MVGETVHITTMKSVRSINDYRGLRRISYILLVQSYLLIKVLLIMILCTRSTSLTYILSNSLQYF